MYGKTPITVVTIVTTATTGFAVQAYVLAAGFLIVSGVLLLHWGRRRVAAR